MRRITIPLIAMAISFVLTAILLVMIGISMLCGYNFANMPIYASVILVIIPIIALLLLLYMLFIVGRVAIISDEDIKKTKNDDN